jgi:hypothetical protein
MSNMLIDERPIMFLPSLAKALGSCERAIVLQQIHFLLRQPNTGMWDDDGVHWVWGTYEEWCKEYFLMWSPHTLRKHIQKLEEDGVLISAQLRAHQHDRTKFYRIHYAHEWLAPMRPDAVGSMRPDDTPSKQPDTDASLYRTETSSKTTAEGKMRPTRARKGNYHDQPTDGKRSYNPDDYPNL